MDKNDIIKSISNRSDGEIYLGVVGAVRTGKSTFIKRFIENLVVPNISDEYEKKRCLDEIPQSSSGKTIMTTEPKFVPSSGAVINVDNFETKIKLIDCVGYVIPGASGYEDDDGNPRMVKTPWTSEEIPFIDAAEIGTQKVIRDHASIGIVVTTDASFGDIPRKDYIKEEERVINELKEIGKPFIVLLNSMHPTNTETIGLADKLREKYDVPILPISCEKLNEKDIMEILKVALYEFPIINVEFNIPEWIHVLPNNHEVKKEFLDKIRNSTSSIDKLKDVDSITNYFKDSKYISNSYISSLDTSLGVASINLESDNSLYDSLLKEAMGGDKLSKGAVLKLFMDANMNREYANNIDKAMKMAKSVNYGIVYPTLKDMKLEKPTIIKQGSRYGVRLKAIASSIHLVKVDVENVFEPIIGSEKECKDLIEYLMKDSKESSENIWKSEIFGRSLENIVKEGIRAKLAYMPDSTRYKLSSTITKIVNKGANNLIAFVI